MCIWVDNLNFFLLQLNYLTVYCLVIYKKKNGKKHDISTLVTKGFWLFYHHDRGKEDKLQSRGAGRWFGRATARNQREIRRYSWLHKENEGNVRRGQRFWNEDFNCIGWPGMRWDKTVRRCYYHTFFKLGRAYWQVWSGSRWHKCWYGPGWKGFEGRRQQNVGSGSLQDSFCRSQLLFSSTQSSSKSRDSYFLPLFLYV